MLVQARERLELAMDAAEHGFWDCNLDTNEVYLSPRYYTMLGYDPGELPMVKDTWVELMHPEDRKIIVPQVEAYVQNAESYEVEFRLKCKDGNWKWISRRGKSYDLTSDGLPNRVLGIHVDITERKQVEQQRAEDMLELKQAKETAMRMMEDAENAKRGIEEINKHLELETARANDMAAQD